eukprot:6085695-Amphidinium_carterae.1
MVAIGQLRLLETVEQFKKECARLAKESGQVTLSPQEDFRRHGPCSSKLQRRAGREIETD